MSAIETTGPSTNSEKIWYHPSTEIAREVQRSSRVRMIKDGKKKKFPILPVYQEDIKANSDELLWGKLGDGMTLYFDFLKLMCWVFAVTTLLAIPQLVLSSMGGTYVASDGVFGLSTPPYNAPLAKLTISNLFFNDSLWSGRDELNQMRNMTIGGDIYSSTPRKVGLVLTLLDITGIIVFLAALTMFDKRISKKADRVGKNAYNIQQYSVVVKGLPRHAKEDAIRRLFSIFGPIADIKVASYSADFLKYLQEKSGIEEELVDLLSSGFKEIQQERDNAQSDGCCSKRKPGEAFEVGEHIPKIAIANNTIYTRRAKHIPMLRRMGELERQLQKFSNSQEDDKTDCYACFITFEKISDRNNCLKMYDDSLYARLGRGMRTAEEVDKISFKYEASAEEPAKKACSKPVTGTISVLPRVYAATAPTNIMWENLEYHRGARLTRKVVVGIITAIMILVSFACIYATSVYSTTLNDPSCDTQIKKPPCGLFLSGSGCNNSFTKDMEPASRSICYSSMMASFANSSDNSCKACWCVEALNSITDILRDDLILNKEYNKACEQPIISFFVRRSLLQGSVAFIVVINIILKAGLAYLVPQEKHHTRTESEMSLVEKVFVSQFINTALVALLVNTRISGFAERFGTSGGAKFPLFTGPYEDFNLPWYIDIGGNHVVTMISNAVQTFIPLVVLWPIQVIQETWATRNTATQIILNRQLKGAVFEVAARYGVLLSTVYSCMLYSASMPFLNIVLFFTFLFSYWVDRIYLLRVCRAPPAYDTGLVKFAVKSLRWAVIGHLLVGMWSFSALMPREPVSETINNYVQSLLGESLDPDLQKFNFIARLFSWVAFPFLLFLVFFILSTIGHRVIWDKVLRPMFLRCFKTSKFLQRTVVDDSRTGQPEFAVALKDDKWVGPTSYSVARMDDYVQAFADHGDMLAKRESKKSDITRADVRRMIFDKTINLQKDYIKQRIGEVVAEQMVEIPRSEIELPELHRNYESDKSSESPAGVLTRPSSSFGGPVGSQPVQMAQVTQAALLKRRTGQDEQRSTPESDGGAAAEIDDAGSMYSSASGVGIIPAAMAAVPDSSDQESVSTTPYGTRSSAAP